MPQQLNESLISLSLSLSPLSLFLSLPLFLSLSSLSLSSLFLSWQIVIMRSIVITLYIVKVACIVSVYILKAIV